MKLNLKDFAANENTKALLKAVASKDKATSENAQAAIAEFIGPVALKVINAAPSISNLFTKIPYDSYGDTSIPLDLYTDVSSEHLMKVWGQYENGGLAYNMPVPATNELKFNDYELDTAFAFNKKYLASGRLDVLNRTIVRLAQQLLLKQEFNSALVLMTAAARATSTVKGASTKHVIRSGTAGQLKMDDLNKLFTLTKRLNSAWNQGTPTASARGLTDMLVSPEVIESIRAISYNPVNTNAGKLTDIAATDAQRNEIYANAGNLSLMGVKFHELLEFGKGCKWNDLFSDIAGSTTFGGTAFDPDATEIAIGLDLDREFLLRPVAVDEEAGSEFQMFPDDQFKVRDGKVGWYGKMREARIAVDDRPITGIII